MKPKKKSVVERAVEALKEHGPMTMEQLAKRAQTTRDSLYTYRPQLQAAGVTKTQANAHEGAVYALGPLAHMGGQPDALAAGAEMGRRKPPAERINNHTPKRREHLAGSRPVSRNGEAPAADRTSPAPHDQVAQFAINETGELGIEKGGSKMRLDREEFYRLREFVQRTESVWQGADKVDLSGIVGR